VTVPKEYLGRGIKFPFQIDDNGRTTMSEGATHLAEAIRHLLSTRVEERVMRRDYGSRIYEVPFEANDDATYALIRQFVISAIRKWERRVLVDEVTVTPDHENNMIRVRIPFTILKNNQEGNLVFPFYLHETSNV